MTPFTQSKSYHNHKNPNPSLLPQMRSDHGAADEHGGHPPHGGRGVHAPQHHQALRQGPQPRLLLQLSTSYKCVSPWYFDGLNWSLCFMYF